MRHARFAWACAQWLLISAWYRIRPYDVLADERRWFWQPRHTCCIVLHTREDMD